MDLTVPNQASRRAVHSLSCDRLLAAASHEVMYEEIRLASKSRIRQRVPCFTLPLISSLVLLLRHSTRDHFLSDRWDLQAGSTSSFVLVRC